LIGNGDIASPEAALEAFDKCKVNGIMIARAMLKDPWIFRKIKEFSEGRGVFEPDPVQKGAVFRHYAELLREDGLPEKAVLGRMKQKAVKYMRLKPGGAGIRTNALRSNSLNEFFTFADQYFRE
jgi:tRNA-dihydrouridine synthase